MFSKMALAIATTFLATAVVAHPVNEKHTRENIAAYYKLDLTPETVIEEVEVVREVEKPVDTWGVISINYIAEDGIVDSQEYVEFEGGLAVGNFDLYGFIDVSDESSFIKLNPTYFIKDSNWFASYTLKHLVVEGKVLSKDIETTTTDQYIGFGHKFETQSGGFFKTSLNVRHTNMDVSAEFNDVDIYMGAKGSNGYALLTSFAQPISKTYNVQVDGWVDVHMGMETHDIYGAAETQVLGNVGIRKSFDNGLYGRLGYQFNEHDGKGDDFGAAHLQVGYKF